MTNTFTLRTPEDGWGFKPISVGALREQLAHAHAGVELEIQMPDGSVRKAYGIELNRTTRDTFRILLASDEPHEPGGGLTALRAG